ncbi:MAG: DUF4350 domain-containing protein [Caldilineaceae bacterium]
MAATVVNGSANGSANGRLHLGLGLALLVSLVAFALLQGEPAPPRPYDPSSTAANGTRALWLWLEAMGLQVEELTTPAASLPAELRLIFVFPNQQPYSAAEADQLARWVQAGGTLVWVGPSASDEALIARFNIEPGPPVDALFFTVGQVQPLFPDLNEGIQLTGQAATLDLSKSPQSIPVLATQDGQVTLALQPFGQGKIWQLSPYHGLTNGELREASQATLVPALLRGVAAGSLVFIDTYHLFGSGATAGASIQSLQDWLYLTTTGWATLFALLVTFLYLLLNGRRLGKPLPAQAEVRPREAAEYVIAMANLFRRAQRRAAVAQHHKQRLKRTLGRSLRLSPARDDPAFLQQLEPATAQWPAEDQTELITLLRRLDEQLDERTLVQTVSQVDTLLARHKQGR